MRPTAKTSTTSSAETLDRLARWALPLLVVMAVLAAFSPALDNAFLSWDDKAYLLENNAYRGLSLGHLRWMITTTRGGLYQPLTWLSFGADYALWGMQPWGYHLTNVLLHALAALLFYYASLRFFAAVGLAAWRERAVAATVAALVFGVHPLRVESVAWVAERKDVLAGVFSMGCLLAYLHAAAGSRSRHRLKLGLSAALFALSLCAKPSGVMLPAALLILDRFLGRPWRASWREKIPFAALSAAAAAATLGALSKEMQSLDARDSAWRAGQALHGFWFYLAKTAWPSSLCAYYPPQPWFQSWSPRHAGLFALTAVTAFALWRSRRKSPALAASLVAYAVLILPVLGGVQVSVPTSACDRLSYLPSLPLSLLAGGFVMRGFLRPRWALSAAAGVLVLWGSFAWRRTGTVWHDTLTFWRSTSAVQPSALALSNFGAALADAGLLEEAFRQWSLAEGLDPQFPDTFANSGVTLMRTGDYARAAASFERELRLRKTAVAFTRLAQCRLRLAEPRQALAAADEALKLDSASAAARHYRARALGMLGRAKESFSEYGSCLQLEPDRAAARLDLGLALAQAGRRPEAIEQYRRALYDGESRAEAQANWAEALSVQGRHVESERRAREALRMAPEMAPARVTLGNSLARQGRLVEAQEQYSLVLARRPDNAAARANRAAVEAVLRQARD